MNLRDYQVGDEQAYVHIWNEACKACSWYSKHGPETVDNIREKIKNERNTSSSYKLIFATVSGNGPVGFIEAKMEDVENGLILNYTPCVLPRYRQRNIESALVKAAIEYLQKLGARKVKFSIMGRAGDTTPYVDFYSSLGFQIWRKAQFMYRSVDNLPERAPRLSLKLLTAKEAGYNVFADLFIECFQDSKDRHASHVASNFGRTKKRIQQLREREGQHPDPDGWIVALVHDKYVGFVIAIHGEDGYGLIAEVGVIPQFRRFGIGAFLTVKALERLKERGFKGASLGVDFQNEAAISLYEKLGFKKAPWEGYELEKSMVL